MKAIAINGSPRRGGNTEIMLKKVLEPLEAAGWSTEYRQIGGKYVRCDAYITINIGQPKERRRYCACMKKGADHNEVNTVPIH
jgi:multimeric flavodoxin WrbA